METAITVITAGNVIESTLQSHTMSMQIYSLTVGYVTAKATDHTNACEQMKHILQNTIKSNDIATT
jgi:hypothetical protein